MHHAYIMVPYRYVVALLNPTSSHPMRRFPDCQCNQNISNSPYRIEILNRTSTGAGGTFCFNLYTAPCDTGSPCCSTQLYKIALPVRECRVKGRGGMRRSTIQPALTA